MTQKSQNVVRIHSGSIPLAEIRAMMEAMLPKPYAVGAEDSASASVGNWDTVARQAIFMATGKYPSAIVYVTTTDLLNGEPIPELESGFDQAVDTLYSVNLFTQLRSLGWDQLCHETGYTPNRGTLRTDDRRRLTKRSLHAIAHYLGGFRRAGDLRALERLEHAFEAMRFAFPIGMIAGRDGAWLVATP